MDWTKGATMTDTDARTWQVTRFCCSSGMCLECRAVANGGTRKRIVHCDRLTRAKAEQMARNWSAHFEAKAEPMPGPSC